MRCRLLLLGRRQWWGRSLLQPLIWLASGLGELTQLGLCAVDAGVAPAATDDVSALTAAQVAVYAQRYQAVSTQTAAIHETLVNRRS